MSGDEKQHYVAFWLKNPCILVEEMAIFPNDSMDVDQRLNALTRLCLLISLGMWFFGYKYWVYFFVGSLVMIIAIKIWEKNIIKEGFTIPPTYTDGSAPMTTVPPLFAEEWQIPPPAYDVYNMSDVNNPYTLAATESQECLNQQPYPIFSQYLSDTTLLPHQEEEVKNRPLVDAQMYMTDARTRDEIDYRNNISRLYTNRFNREYRHGCFDQITPYSSW